MIIGRHTYTLSAREAKRSSFSRARTARLDYESAWGSLRKNSDCLPSDYEPILPAYAKLGEHCMVITDNERSRAEARMNARRRSGPLAISARYDRRLGKVIVLLDSGVEFRFPVKLVEGLDDAEPEKLSPIELSPSGLGMHFPKLDADVYLPALLGGVFGSRKWMATALGKEGGSRSSAAKAQAARQNGKLGGRPRKNGEVSGQKTPVMSEG